MVKIKTRPIRLLCLLFFLCGLQNGLQALTDTLDGKDENIPFRPLCILLFLCGLQNDLQALTDTLDGKDENTPFPATLSSLVPLWFLEWSVVSRAVMQKSLQFPEGIK